MGTHLFMLIAFLYFNGMLKKFVQRLLSIRQCYNEVLYYTLFGKKITRPLNLKVTFSACLFFEENKSRYCDHHNIGGVRRLLHAKT